MEMDKETQKAEKESQLALLGFRHHASLQALCHHDSHSNIPLSSI